MRHVLKTRVPHINLGRVNVAQRLHLGQGAGEALGQVLVALEKKLKQRNGPDARISDHFDLVAGTSTGGILACVLLCPDPDKRVWVYGTEGGLVFPDGTLHHAGMESGPLLDTQITPRGTPFGEYDQAAFSAAFDAFAEAALTGAESPVPPEQSLQVQSILEGIYRSHQSGAEVRLD